MKKIVAIADVLPGDIGFLVVCDESATRSEPDTNLKIYLEEMEEEAMPILHTTLHKPSRTWYEVTLWTCTLVPNTGVAFRQSKAIAKALAEWASGGRDLFAECAMPFPDFD